MLVANTVAHTLRGWEGKLQSVAEDLAASGLTTEALVVQGHVSEHMRKALAETNGTPSHDVLAARCLANACGRVLGVAHPEAARAIAEDLRNQGAEELAKDLLWLADRSTNLAEASPGPAVGE